MAHSMLFSPVVTCHSLLLPALQPLLTCPARTCPSVSSQSMPPFTKHHLTSLTQSHGSC